MRINLKLNRKMAQLALLQRIELASPFQKRTRKILGRYLFSNFISKYLISLEKISQNYSSLMGNEVSILSKFLKQKQNILSIGGGIGGLEVLIMKEFYLSNITFIEKNYISKKIKYGWDQNNIEAYNNIAKLKIFLSNNGMMKSRYNIYDFDRDNLPSDKFDCIISLYSLDYHYDFKLYEDYLQRTFHQNSILIFDTIRPDYFLKLFDDVKIIASTQKNIHSSKRILCRGYKY